MEKKWFLSLDGGGALGIGPVSLLAKATEELPLQPHAYAGTSVGALLVALAATGKPWGLIQEIFLQTCPRIFTKPPWTWRINPWRPRYDGIALQAACQYHLGTLRMCDLLYPTFITAFDFKNGRPKVFDHTDTIPVWYAVMCSTAAPTYFPIVDGQYGDGGLVANNPMMVGLAGCLAKCQWSLASLSCLSLGTNGYAWDPPRISHCTKLGWLKPLLNTFMDGSEELATFQGRAIFRDRLYRIEPVLQHALKLDDVRTAFAWYRTCWEELWPTHRTPLKAWLHSYAQES